MAQIEIIKPASQPNGDFRLLNWLDDKFSNGVYDSFRCLVAFAKVKPLYKLHESIQKWTASGKSLAAIIGVDHKGTSIQALQYALSNFNNTYILHAEHSTFHPKLYIFSSATEAAVFYGSNNMTSGGLETNFEGGVILTLSLPADNDLFLQAKEAFESLLPGSINCSEELTPVLLDQMNKEGWLLDESKAKPTSTSSRSATTSSSSGAIPLFKPYRAKPPKAISKAAVAAAAKSAGIAVPHTPATSGSGVTASTSTTSTTMPHIRLSSIIDGLVMQVAPHKNGEILLSAIAINQNPDFFGFPFTGQTVPKKATNPTYPQREPDPVVNIYVYDDKGGRIHTEEGYKLNTVFYSPKKELRITITPSIIKGLNYDGMTNYPILVMTNSGKSGCDYDLHFYAEGSVDYNDYLKICNQTLPSGGKSVARKMGWI